MNDIIANSDLLFKGLRITLMLGILSGVTSLVLGTLLGLARYSNITPLKICAVTFIEITRSIPLVLYIVFIYLTCSPILGQINIFHDEIFGSLEFQSAFIALSLFTSAYIAEIVRSGLKSVETTQIQAAKALGLNIFQRLKYVILPCAISRMMPALVSQFISLIKDTSLASIIGLIEFTRSGEIIYERTYNETQILALIALVYFVICYGMSQFSKKLEQRPFGIIKLGF
jgi:His/Glu/Gln/Arg/opine family amino acid ABC transporter permease subunit